ncbi:MAG TPA: hypothetical protein VME66_15895 [Candidatus Acidoferrales bacterium]|nr:hypothetical protein [Candidatus Acidoferrales bacterium]
MTKLALIPLIFAATVGIALAADRSDDPQACDNGWAHQNWHRTVVHCHEAQKEAWTAGDAYKAAFYESREAYAYSQLHRDADARAALREARNRAAQAGASALLQVLNNPNFFTENSASMLNNP